MLVTTSQVNQAVIPVIVDEKSLSTHNPGIGPSLDGLSAAGVI